MKSYRVEAALRNSVMAGRPNYVVWQIWSRYGDRVADNMSERSARRICRLLNADNAKRRNATRG